MQIIHVKICTYLSERCVRLIASVEDSGLNGPGLNPGCGHCVVFHGKTHNLAVPSRSWKKCRPLVRTSGLFFWESNFSLPLSRWQRNRQVVCQLCHQKNNLRLAQGKQNQRAACQRASWNSFFFFQTLWGLPCYGQASHPDALLAHCRHIWICNQMKFNKVILCKWYFLIP